MASSRPSAAAQSASHLLLSKDKGLIISRSATGVEHRKVTFHKGFGMESAADMYIPKDATGKLAAIAVSGP